MSAIELKKQVLIRGRMAILGHKMTPEEAEKFLTLCQAQWWKFVPQSVTQEMLEGAVRAHTPELLWQHLWQRA